MGRNGIESLLFALDNALGGSAAAGYGWHTLHGNLRAVPASAWDWRPPGGKRSIRDIVEHLGAIRVWESQSFGDGSLTWENLGSKPWLSPAATPDEAIAWVDAEVAAFRASVAALPDDRELAMLRMTPQGKLQETRWIIVTMIEHLLYHCGEINHIRALCVGDDE